jgi:hypothetical protein
LHDGSWGFVLQSTGGGGGGVVWHDGSLGFLLQSTGGVGSVDLHDGSLGFVVQSTDPPGVGSGAFWHSGEVDPCSHVGGVGSSGGGGGVSAANGYYIEFSNSSIIAEQAKAGEEGEEDTRSTEEQRQQNGDKSNDLYDVMIIRFNISYKFSQFLGNVYRILLEEFCTIKQFELTETLAFYEYRKKQLATS